MENWMPTSPLEVALGEAYEREDDGPALALLRSAELVLPITKAAFDGDEPPEWATYTDEHGGTHVVAYTSVELMQQVGGDRFGHGRITTFPGLAAGWPDNRWGLAVNPGVPVFLTIDAATLAQWSALTLEQQQEIFPDAPVPLMQKVIGVNDLFDLFTVPITRISGYVHQLGDVLDVPTPGALVEALGIINPAEFIFNNGSINLLRWPAVASDLYRIPFGGRDAAQCAAVDGWVVEEEPFVGLGFAPNPNSTVVEFKVTALELPHGAEVWEFDRNGDEHRRAIYSADTRTWYMVRAVADPPQEDPPGPPRMRVPDSVSAVKLDPRETS
ncbi:SseB family protein [Antricoccus suffuscus]|nr:SseB family protein [Antricoccus suffuscus]